MTHQRLTALQVYGVISVLCIAIAFVFIGIRATVFMVSFLMIFFLAIGGTRGMVNTVPQMMI